MHGPSGRSEAIRRRAARWGAALLAIALGSAGLAAAAGAAGGAKQAKAPASAPSAKLEPAALAVVQKMADRLVSAERIRLDGEVAWSSVQADGQLIEFGATREIVLQRPDHLRVDTTLREGGRRRLLWNGKEVMLEDLEHNVYATAPLTGSFDDLVAFVSARLGVPIALAELLSPELPALIEQHVDSARSVGVETIGGVRCDHVALRNDVVGMELWIGQGDSLPRQIVITYEHETGHPQFRSRFTDFDLSPRVTDATFAFEPPKGAERIAFAPLSPGRQKGGAR